MNQVVKESFFEQLKQKGFIVSYNKVGSGKRVIFTFAGVGMDERYFSKYFKEAEEDYTFYHFYIKVTSVAYKDEVPLIWVAFVQTLLEEHQIEQLNIVSYSIGARLAYPLFDLYQLDQLILICPDGIFEHPVYRVATKTVVGGMLFHPIFKTLRFFIPMLKRFIKLTSKELFMLWKLYSKFKFPQSVPDHTFVYLASSDPICSAYFVTKMLKKKGFKEFCVIDANHFSILPIIKKDLINKLK